MKLVLVEHLKKMRFFPWLGFLLKNLCLILVNECCVIDVLYAICSMSITLNFTSKDLLSLRLMSQS
jgi:hypothetical protein